MLMIRSLFRSGPFRPGLLRPGLFQKALWCLALVLIAVPAIAFAAQNRGLVVTPLDEGGGVSAPLAQPGAQPGEQPGGQSGGQPSPSTPAAGTTDTAPGMAPGAEGGMMPAFPEQPSYKDGIVMAYLVELMRKQDKACPSGTRPPVPPSLLFSEPLCRVAESVGKGAEFPAAYDEQGIYAARWRMFSASDLPAQTVATRLRAEHCEALLEPYTHIGAWRGPSGWRIVLATLTDKPQPELITPGAASTAPDAPQAVPAPGAESAVPASAPAAGKPIAYKPAATPEELVIAVPVKTPAASAQKPAAPAGHATPTPAAATAALVPLDSIPDPAPTSAVTPTAPATAPTAPDTSGVAPFMAGPDPAPATSAPVPAQAQGGQEARALFSLINDLRVKGGSCLGRASVTAPPLSFSSALQVEAEKSAADAAAKGAFSSQLGIPQDHAAGAPAYPGVKVSKLTAASRAPVSAVLDVWMVSPTRCDSLLSSDFTEAGAAYVDGYWVLLLGQRTGSAPAAVKNP